MLTLTVTACGWELREWPLPLQSYGVQLKGDKGGPGLPVRTLGSSVAQLERSGGARAWERRKLPGPRGAPRSLALCLPQPPALPPATSGPRDHNPAVVVTVVTVSALLVLGSVMSVLAMWRR